MGNVETNADPWANVSPFCKTGKHALTWGGTPEKPNYYACDCEAKERLNEFASHEAAQDFYAGRFGY